MNSQMRSLEVCGDAIRDIVEEKAKERRCTNIAKKVSLRYAHKYRSWYRVSKEQENQQEKRHRDSSCRVVTQHDGSSPSEWGRAAAFASLACSRECVWSFGYIPLSCSASLHGTSVFDAAA